MRVLYEGIVKNNPSHSDAVHYLAVWHLERHSFQQVWRYILLIILITIDI